MAGSSKCQMSDFDKAMETFKKLFSSPKKKATPERDVLSLYEPLAQECVRIVTAGTGKSAFYPKPVMAAGGAWPCLHDRPMVLTLLVDLSELHQCHKLPWLPEKGVLLFYVDHEEYWEADAVRVIHVPDAEGLVPFEAPDHEFQERKVGFERVKTYPSAERREVQSFTTDEINAWDEWKDEQFEDRALHQIGGYPEAIQADTMERDAECHRRQDYRTPLGEGFDPASWKLLLQFDSDDDLGVAWGDAGMLYVFLHEDDAREGDFSKVFACTQTC